MLTMTGVMGSCGEGLSNTDHSSFMTSCRFLPDLLPHEREREGIKGDQLESASRSEEGERYHKIISEWRRN